MQTRELGRSGLEVSAIGLGCMGISAAYGTPLSKADGVKLIRDAVSAGSPSSTRPKSMARSPTRKLSARRSGRFATRW